MLTSRSTDTVSYTHLDVYKRQVYIRIIIRTEIVHIHTYVCVCSLKIVSTLTHNNLTIILDTKIEFFLEKVNNRIFKDNGELKQFGKH